MTETERYETEAEVFGSAICDIAQIVCREMTKENWEAIRKIVYDACDAGEDEE
jgi:hypothetical protein